MSAVLITGAGRGLGRELMRVYLEREWTVLPLVRRGADLEEEAAGAGQRCIPVVGDVSSDAVAEPIASALERLDGPLDLLINNAGNIRKHRDLESTTAADLLDHFQVHCAGVLRCVKAALPWLRRAERPQIVNISSRWGSIARTADGKGCGIYAYQVAKTAQNMLTACLDQELSGEGIRVFAVHPGRLRTEVAAADADTDPADAAHRLAGWIDGVEDDAPCGFHDPAGAGRIDW